MLLEGEGISFVSHIRFGINDHYQIVPAKKVNNDTSISCIVPTYDMNGEASIQLSHNGKDFHESGHEFSYRASPHLLALTPSFGGDLGGKTVYISGENFVDTPTLCRFGTSLVNAIYISPTLLSCVTPTNVIGKIPLSITMNGVDFISNSTLQYESIKLPQLESMEPTVGVVNENTTVVLTTTALHEDKPLACHFDDRIVMASYLSSNSVSCAVPISGPAGVVNVSLSIKTNVT